GPALRCNSKGGYERFFIRYFLTAETFSLQQLQISPKMFSEYSSGHFHHPVDLSLLFWGLSLF
ncbi:hypothetical protein, partial [[Ruminococcus] lactaris]